MLNERYRLIAPKQLRIDFVAEKIGDDDLVVRPQYLAICAADQRYYQGLRSKEILDKKLPLTLIHEAIGSIVYDPKNEYPQGTKCVLIPNIPHSDSSIKENYRADSKFASSSVDGFMQQLVVISGKRIIPYTNIAPEAAVMSELLSVGMNAYNNFERVAISNKDTLGIWGNGPVGFMTALILKQKYPNSKVYLFGTDEHRLGYFSFVDGIYLIDQIPDKLKIDHGFECVGGPNSANAINQIIDLINPQGTISLMGVSENPVALNTRMVLEKGLTLIGHSRSSYEDFKQVIELLEKDPTLTPYLQTIVSDTVKVSGIEEMDQAFKLDRVNDFKTVMVWNV